MGHTLEFEEGLMRALFEFLIFVIGSLCLGLMFQAAYKADVRLFLAAIILAVIVWVALMFRRAVVIEGNFGDTRRNLRQTFKRLRKVHGDTFETTEAVFFITETRSWGKSDYVLRRQLKVKPSFSSSTQEVLTEFFLDSPMVSRVYYVAYKRTLIHISFEADSPFGITIFTPATIACTRMPHEVELQALLQQLKSALPKQGSGQ